MHKRRFFLLLLVLNLAIAAVIGINSRLAADEHSAPGLNAKIDKIINNQEQILKKLDDMAVQIQIVKVRATR
jgi:hypothetical protein